MSAYRTSITDPIRIAELPVDSGILGLTFCPGKQGRSVFGAPWKRDLKTDIQAIRDWGAAEVITLIEDHEFEMLSVPDLGDAVQDAGMRWRHLPIPDLDVPDAGFDAVWSEASREVADALSRGEKLLVHCRGGRGRTGLLAALILIDQGYGAEDALRLVRAVRSSAVETRAQENWLFGRATKARSALDQRHAQ